MINSRSMRGGMHVLFICLISPRTGCKGAVANSVAAQRHGPSIAVGESRRRWNFRSPSHFMAEDLPVRGQYGRNSKFFRPRQVLSSSPCLLALHMPLIAM
ncbi:hypothetical protein ASPBRDRAFT_606673 [Aspergillus brasiliensis CBS 101740]|uniref:Secreted protein n=1 Tax=Aspergillus brasiliensis (strain CBS 101740 / IMI 381727 / IBT 21946) TaxID=767769 RepID=A0A1L9UHZ7_ASPBC|nr:hypothetical protein ASPBRDRAFT_606673 [Aspergillus brasiliensis CBS 101740]